MLNWEQKTENANTTEFAENVSKLVNKKLADLEVFSAKEFKSLKGEIDEFFNGKQSEILIQWKPEFEIRLNDLLDQLKQHTENHCKRLFIGRKTISAFEKGRKRNAEEIKRKIQEHIENIKKEQEMLHKSIKSGNLQPQQLRKILERDMFSSEKLAVYEKLKIITPDQVKCIESVIQQSESRYTEDFLKKILYGEMYSTIVVENILKMMALTEKEMKIEFEIFWIEWTSHMQVAYGESFIVEKEVEFTLTEFVEARGYGGQLIEKLSKTSLSEWGTKMNFVPEEWMHYRKADWKNKGWITKMVRFEALERCPDIILKITQDILLDVHVYLKNTTSTETDFQVAYVIGLLNLVEKRIIDCFRIIQDSYEFTLDYSLDMYLISCGIAIQAFDLMAKLFQEKNNPLKYLEKREKGPLFIKFKCHYNQTEAEEAIASTLCAYLEEPIKIRIRKLQGPKMVTQMKSSRQQFSSKMALKVQVLRDLHDKEFEDYMAYVDNVQKYFQEYLEYHAVAYCDEKVTNTMTRLQQTSKEEVNRLVKVVENLVTDTNEKNAHVWLEVFCNDLTFQSELGENLEPDDILRSGDSSHQLDLDSFKLKIKEHLRELKKVLHSSYDEIECKTEMMYWKEKPHELLQDLIGCTKQCLFCQEQCDLLDPNHLKSGVKHSVSIHRMHCVNGWYDRKTQILSSALCPSRVASNLTFCRAGKNFHPYRNYEQIYPDWSIPPDVRDHNCLYWKMFVAKHADSLAKKYYKKTPNVEDDWKKIEWHEVEANLKEVYNI